MDPRWAVPNFSFPRFVQTRTIPVVLDSPAVAAGSTRLDVVDVSGLLRLVADGVLYSYDTGGGSAGSVTDRDGLPPSKKGSKAGMIVQSSVIGGLSALVLLSSILCRYHCRRIAALREEVIATVRSERELAQNAKDAEQAPIVLPECEYGPALDDLSSISWYPKYC